MPRNTILNRSGFTILEVLIAFAIAGLALSVLAKTVGIATQSVRVAGRYQDALSRAQSHLARIGQATALAARSLEIDDGDGFRYRLKIVPVAQLAPKPAGEADPGPDADTPRLTLFAVEVTESFTENGKVRDIILKTERLGLIKANKNG